MEPALATCLPLPSLKAHRLVPDVDGPEDGRMRLEQPGLLAADLRQHSFGLVHCPDPLAAPVARMLRLGPALLEETKELQTAAAAAGLALQFKRQGLLKERLQVRRARRPAKVGAAAEAAADAAAVLEAAHTAMESVALACFEAWCATADVPSAEALEKFGDQDPNAGEKFGKTKAQSVLNLYHYFNEAGCDEEPCREHADPGLLTVLCRSTNEALQVRLPTQPGGAPGEAASYEEPWRDVEPLMDEGLRAADARPGDVVLLIATGETLERLSGSSLASCRHRVTEASGRRFNAAFEMRPRMNVWHPWAAMAQGLAPSATGEALAAAVAPGDAPEAQ